MNKFLRFMVAGIPAFVAAFALNYWLVNQVGLPTPLAYALVLVVQIVLNFLGCRYLVFDIPPDRNLWRAFVVYFNGIALFRLADWGLYSLLTGHWGVFPMAHGNHFYLYVQLFNVALFSLLKYEFARRVFERKPAPAPAIPVRATDPISGK
jgi:putative flippase GtrA